MIIHHPSGVPELACSACGCRWFDRIANTCYECGEPVTEADLKEYEQVYREYFKRELNGNVAG